MTMPKGPHRQVLDRYLDSAQEGHLRTSGSDWKRKAFALDTLAQAMKAGAEQAELRIGEQSLTGPAIRKGMEESSISMTAKSEQLEAAGEALVQVSTQIADTREARDSMKDLGEKPNPYQPPSGTPGVPLTPEEINAQAAASQARQGARDSWQDAFDKQEAQALALTKQMDAAFLDAIPPMKAIHGQSDPTEPAPNVPSGPGGPLLPGTQVPTTGGGGGGGGGDHVDRGVYVGQLELKDPGTGKPDPTVKDPTIKPDPTVKDPTIKDPTVKDPTIKDPTVKGPTGVPTTNVIGTSQTGVTYTPGGSTIATPVSAAPGAAGMSSGATLGAAGMAGAAGGLSAGGVRGGGAPAVPARSSSAPVRAIGSTGRSGSASALSRGAISATSGPAARPAAPGSAAGTRAGAPSSASGTRGGAPGSTAGRGGAGGRAGAAGARGAGAAGASAAGARGTRKGVRDGTTDRDSLVYDQDWLGDDEVAPGVLD